MRPILLALLAAAMAGLAWTCIAVLPGDALPLPPFWVAYPACVLAPVFFILLVARQK